MECHVPARNVRFCEEPSVFMSGPRDQPPTTARNLPSNVDTLQDATSSLNDFHIAQYTRVATVGIAEICDREEFLPIDIFTAASVGDTNTCRLLLFSGLDVNQSNKGGWTPLMYAAFFGRDDCVRLLLDNGAKVDVSNRTGQRALMLAASNGNCSTIGILFEANANGNAVDNRGWTALFYAVECNQSTAAETLLRNAGACCDVNQSDGKSGLTVLLLACRGGHELLVDILLRYGANPDARTVSGETALELAMTYEHPNVLTLLHNKRREIDESLAPPPPRSTAAGPSFYLGVGDTRRPTSEPRLGASLNKNPVIGARNAQTPTASKPQAAVEPLPAPTELSAISPLNERSQALRRCTSIVDFLDVLGLARLTTDFAAQEVDFEQFLQLTDVDLKELGLKFGPKKKIADAINKYHSQGRPATVQQAESAYLAERQRADNAVKNSEQISIELSEAYETIRQLKEDVREQRRTTNQLRAAMQVVRRTAGTNRIEAHDALAKLRGTSAGSLPGTKQLVAIFSRVASNCDQQLLKAAECGCVGE